MPSLRPMLVLLACAAACTDRTHPHSELGHQLALHFCPVHDQCDCEDEPPIPNCEVRVEQEFIVTERRAIDAGLELDEGCFEDLLHSIDQFTACGRPETSWLCPVYTTHADVGEPCEIYDRLPWVSECRAGLFCTPQGVCRNRSTPPPLYEGEICSATQAILPTGWLGECAAGLTCDSYETRTCVPATYWPPVPTGGACARHFICVDESYCHTDDPAGPSEERPGICTPRTPEGQPCDNLFECPGLCTDGVCETQPPRMCDALSAWWARE